MHQPPTDVIFFDLGNVLVYKDDQLLLRRLAERAGRTPSKDEASRYEPEFWLDLETGRIPRDRIREEVCRRAGLDMSEEAFFKLWGSHYEINREIVPLSGEIEDRTRLFLLSNTNPLHYEFIRPKIPFLECFEGYFLSYEMGLRKPDRAFYQRAIDAAGVSPDRIVYFEDVPEYADVAHELGVRTFVYQDYATFRAQLESLRLYRAPFDPAGPPKVRIQRL